MKKTIYITLLLTVFLILLLVVLWSINVIDLITLLPHLLFLSGLLATGISFILLHSVKGLLKYAGMGLATTGMLLWAFCAYGIGGTVHYWNIAISMIFSGLAIGMYAAMQMKNARFGWIFLVALLMVISASTGIMLGVESPVFYSFGLISLTFFSLIAFVSGLIKRS